MIVLDSRQIVSNNLLGQIRKQKIDISEEGKYIILKFSTYGFRQMTEIIELSFKFFKLKYTVDVQVYKAVSHSSSFKK